MQNIALYLNKIIFYTCISYVFSIACNKLIKEGRIQDVSWENRVENNSAISVPSLCNVRQKVTIISRYFKDHHPIMTHVFKQNIIMF